MAFQINQRCRAYAWICSVYVFTTIIIKGDDSGTNLNPWEVILSITLPANLEEILSKRQISVDFDMASIANERHSTMSSRTSRTRVARETPDDICARTVQNLFAYTPPPLQVSYCKVVVGLPPYPWHYPQIYIHKRNDCLNFWSANYYNLNLFWLGRLSLPKQTLLA